MKIYRNHPIDPTALLRFNHRRIEHMRFYFFGPIVLVFGL